jgi:hypothetical protein
MKEQKPKPKVALIDQLMSRPEGSLPPMIGVGDHERGGPADPKPKPVKGQGDPDETNPPPDDIGRTA